MECCRSILAWAGRTTYIALHADVSGSMWLCRLIRCTNSQVAMEHDAGESRFAARRDSAERFRSRRHLPEWGVVVLSVVFIGAACICPFFGAEHLEVQRIVDGWLGQPSVDADIFFLQRLPRVGVALLTGGALALTGAVLQVLLRNPLAEPFTLGITGGSALGAVTALSVPWLRLAWGPFDTVQAAALVGGGTVALFMYVAARRQGRFSMNVLLLAGVTISIFCSSLIMLVRYLVNPHLLVQLDRWLMGGLDIAGYRELATMLPLLLPGLALLLIQATALNHLALDEDFALGHGVDVEAVRREAFIGGSMATAAVVALAGPVGFVGLVTPHMVRRLCGYDHRYVLPASFLLGGALLAVCDTLARTLAAPAEVPVGIVTAVFGCPAFFYILLRMQRHGRETGF